MDKPSQKRFDWQKALKILAIALGTATIVESPGIAIAVETTDSFKIAQVGVRSRITPPTPLNITPRIHIPLPASRYNRHQNYYGFPRSRGSYNRWRSRNYRQDRRYDRYNGSGYDDHPRQSRRGYRKRGKIIISF